MATVTPRRTLAFQIQKRLSSLSASQLKTVASSIDDGSVACNIDDMSEPELYDRIVDYIRSEKLEAMEDAGLAQLHHLDDLLSSLLTNDTGEIGAGQAAPREMGNVISQQQGYSAPPHPDPNYPGRNRGIPSRNLAASATTTSLSEGAGGAPSGKRSDCTDSSLCGAVSDVNMAQFTNVSSKYQDIISRSILISSGSPSVYQLKPKKEEIGTLPRMTVGERNMKKPNKTILLVGETGSGKSTLINSLVNYTMGVKFEDEVWFQIVEEEKRSQSQTQTLDVNVYQIFGFEDRTLPYSLTIIDTPGYGDTRGIEHDAIISQRLFDLFRSEDGVHEVNAVGLVMKATENRLNHRLVYVFSSVMSLFGKDLEKNIVALITHSDGDEPENALKALEAAKIKCAKNEKNQPVYFLFNNKQSKGRTKGRESLEHADKISMRGMREFTTFLEKAEPQKLEKTVYVMKERVRLTACIQNLEERINLTELKQNEIKPIQEEVKKHEEEMKNNERFTVEVDEVYKEKEDIDAGMWGLVFYEGAVCCTVCEENCHYPGCTVAWYPGHCEVMKDGRCTSCTNKCPVTDHVKEKWKYVTKTRKVQKTEAEMKQKYEKNKSKNEKKLSLLENLEKEMNQLRSETSQLLDKAYQHVVILDLIALNVNSVSTYVDLDFLIEKMKERGDREKVQKLEEMKDRVDEGTTAGIQYVWGKLKGIGKKVKDTFI